MKQGKVEGRGSEEWKERGNVAGMERRREEARERCGHEWRGEGRER